MNIKWKQDTEPIEDPPSPDPGFPEQPNREPFPDPPPPVETPDPPSPAKNPIQDPDPPGVDWQRAGLTTLQE